MSRGLPGGRADRIVGVVTAAVIPLSVPGFPETPRVLPVLAKAPTGIAGLDEVTSGGLPRGRATLVCGPAGCGKTLLAMEFLVRGITAYGELYVSVGVAFASSGDSGELLRNADAAMYLAKQRGRNRAELFDEKLRQAAADRLSLLADLRHAVTRGELRLHYQPVFSLRGEHFLGVEALVRWQHPCRGLLFPDAFIPAAESANLIGDIGAWVLQTACRQAAAWAHAGAGGAPLHMAVNVSAKQLAHGSGLVPLVAAALRDARIDPATLVLEVTESAVMDDAEATLAILTELKGLGVKLAIDDFGTGYSSLVYLKRFPVDQLKVDRSFVSGLGTDSDDAAIVASVVGLARAVGIVAIAEGVETAGQLAALQRLGCTWGQGYLWSRPVPAEELDQVIRSGGFPRLTPGPTQPLPTGAPTEQWAIQYRHD
jgi:EAL domain-containing protein (putative c-di-GMP-specific phosphodiesterase class I)